MVDGSTALTIHLVYPTTDPSTPSGSADTAAVNATASATALAGAMLFFGTADASSLSSALGQQVTAVAPTTMQQDQRRPLAITSTATPPSGAGGGGSGDSRGWVISLVCIACVLAIILCVLGSKQALKYHRSRSLKLITHPEYGGKELNMYL